jgi:hypothetical protein
MHVCINFVKGEIINSNDVPFIPNHPVVIMTCISSFPTADFKKYVVSVPSLGQTSV